LTRGGPWECDYDLRGVLRFVDEQIEELGLDLDPDFQRGHIWTEKQQALWLQHHLRGGKSGRVIYFNFPGWSSSYKGDFVLVDGRQRLEAIRAFLENEIKVFNAYYNEYTDHVFLRGMNTMRLNINNLPTRAAVLQWYVEMNAGGTPHSDKEIARVLALYDDEVAVK
jgi:hypothetical protein